MSEGRDTVSCCEDNGAVSSGEDSDTVSSSGAVSSGEDIDAVSSVEDAVSSVEDIDAVSSGEDAVSRNRDDSGRQYEVKQINIIQK